MSTLDLPIVRVTASSLSLVGVPVLLVVACRAWATRERDELPPWRNGIGLSAMSLVALAWMWFAIGLADTSLTPKLGAMYFDLTLLAVVCTCAATAFACAWKGRCRLEALMACILMGVGWRFFGYS